VSKRVTPDGFLVDVYQVSAPPHPSQYLRDYVPSEVYPHITALQEVGLYDRLSEDDQGLIIKLMQAAYRRGKASQGAEKIDGDMAWVDGVGGLERQPDGSWKLVTPDRDLVSAVYAAAGSATSEAKAAAARANGKKGGRPRKQKPTE